MTREPGMTIAELIDRIHYVTDVAGNRTAVMVDWDVWEEILKRLAEPSDDEVEDDIFGKDLLTQVETLVEQQRVEYGEQNQVSEDFNQAYQAADEAYRMTLKIARVAFKGNIKAEQSIDLNGRRKQTQTFYNNLLAEADFIVRMGNWDDRLAHISARI